MLDALLRLMMLEIFLQGEMENEIIAQLLLEGNSCVSIPHRAVILIPNQLEEGLMEFTVY